MSLGRVFMFLCMASQLSTAILAAGSPRAEPRYWLSRINRLGTVPYGHDPKHMIFRNVVDYGAKGDGKTDDTEAINKAIADGQRCGMGCSSSTIKPALVYIPPGTYRINTPIVQLCSL
ncbi:pectate lyase superfamily protein-domain-containing protein [Podospora didyma]|uniref:Pectate lyase superfamily protein-domain-containing protein n=1 Tax=Podospora didyma TaxID=330526 RepID=A0AAE0JYH7_9PEZI|nr:pectate lyase superfamily protein-domain-containing protein [Podospora didyma]